MASACCRDVGRDHDRMAFRRADPEAVAAAGARFERSPAAWPTLAPIALAWACSASTVARSAAEKCTPEQRRPRPLPQGDDVMLAAGAAQMDGVALGGDVLQGPDPAVEFRGFLQVVDAQLDAAQAVDSGGGHGLGLRRRAVRAGAGGSPARSGSLPQNPTGGRDGDAFCIPPRRAAWLLSHPGGSKFAAKNRSKIRPIMLGVEGPPGTGRRKRVQNRMAEKLVAKVRK